MTKTEAPACLRECQPQLRAMGIERLAISGSTVRGEERQDPDVDLVTEPSHRVRLQAQIDRGRIDVF